MSSGIKEYETGKGLPTQTPEHKANNAYNAREKLDDTYIKHVKGADLENYVVNWKGEYLSYGKWLAAPRDKKYFDGERFIIREIPGKKRLIVSYCSEEFTIKNSAHIGIVKDSKYHIHYIVLLLNSNLMGYYFKHKFAEYDTVFPKAKIGQCKELPIRVISLSMQEPFILKMNQILNLKYISEDTSSLEAEIDQMVYELYGLTDEEIKVVEGR